MKQKDVTLWFSILVAATLVACDQPLETDMAVEEIGVAESCSDSKLWLEGSMWFGDCDIDDWGFGNDLSEAESWCEDFCEKQRCDDSLDFDFDIDNREVKDDCNGEGSWGPTKTLFEDCVVASTSHCVAQYTCNCDRDEDDEEARVERVVRW